MKNCNNCKRRIYYGEHDGEDGNNLPTLCPQWVGNDGAEKNCEKDGADDVAQSMMCAAQILESHRHALGYGYDGLRENPNAPGGKLGSMNRKQI